MLTQAIHNQNSIMAVALQGTLARHDAILNNIANADVPGFRARNVEFEGALRNAINNWRSTGRLDFSGAGPVTRFQDSFHTFRMDGSNVDMEREMVALYINSVRADVMVNSILHNSRMLNNVLQGR